MWIARPRAGPAATLRERDAYSDDALRADRLGVFVRAGDGFGLEGDEGAPVLHVGVVGDAPAGTGDSRRAELDLALGVEPLESKDVRAGHGCFARRLAATQAGRLAADHPVAGFDAKVE